MRTTIALVACVAALTTSACATYLDDLNRAEVHYKANEHERALALFRVLEPDMDSLSRADQARYAYLRGMNDYRMGDAFRTDARHWLAVAKAIDREQPGSLSAEQKPRLDEALRDLNQDVYGVGVFPEEPEDSGQASSDKPAAKQSDEAQSDSDKAKGGDNTAPSDESKKPAHGDSEP